MEQFIQKLLETPMETVLVGVVVYLLAPVVLGAGIFLIGRLVTWWKER